MARYPDEDRFTAELEAVIERHIGPIAESACSDDDEPTFELPTLSAFVCGIEISDAAHEEGRWYIHRSSTKRVSPIHTNGILHEMLNNWTLDDDA